MDKKTGPTTEELLAAKTELLNQRFSLLRQKAEPGKMINDPHLENEPFPPLTERTGLLNDDGEPMMKISCISPSDLYGQVEKALCRNAENLKKFPHNVNLRILPNAAETHPDEIRKSEFPNLVKG